MLLEFLVVFLCTAMITIIVYYWLGGERRRGSLLLLFLSLMLGAWAGGLWIMPFMERVSGYFWSSFVLVAAIYAAIVYFFLWPYRRPETRGEAIRRGDAVMEADRLLKVALTVVLAVSLVYILIRYTV